MARRLSEYQRNKSPFALAMLDVDKFKNFNDTHGHQAGDEVLRGIAEVLRKEARDMDLVARYGGEEMAIVLGAAISVGYGALGIGQEPALVLWQSPRVTDPTLAQWAVGELRNLGVVVGMVTLLISLLRVLEALRVTHAMHWLLAPVFRLIGVSRKASTLTIIGLTLGISYGGGLIIGEARSGRLPGREIFFSLAFLGLCHSLFEDSLLLVLIGGSLPGLVLGRLLFAVVVVAVLVRLTAGLSEERFAWLLLKPAK